MQITRHYSRDSVYECVGVGQRGLWAKRGSLAHPTRKPLRMLPVTLPAEGRILIPGRGQGRSRDRDGGRVAN